MLDGTYCVDVMLSTLLNNKLTINYLTQLIAHVPIVISYFTMLLLRVSALRDPVYKIKIRKIRVINLSFVNSWQNFNR
jgi:hypothetical protein